MIQVLRTLSGEDAMPDELLDPMASAQAVGLRHVSDEWPGLTRKKAGKQFTYWKPDGSKLTDDRTLGRIKALVIPPAWTAVWICASPNGHLQATGRDAKGRKQYRYHVKWRTVRDEVKYDKMLAFAEALPMIRERVDKDLSLPGIPREKVLAVVVRLLEETHIRVGSEEYKKSNKSFGLTTLQDRHARVDGAFIRFRFKGKHGVDHEIELKDRRLARIVQRCRDIPGQDLFQYMDESGARRDVTSGDINAYIRQISGADFTAKDFRTWAGTLLAARFLRAIDPTSEEVNGKALIVRCIETVAADLGNTVAVCRKCYVHPSVLEAFMLGALKLSAGNGTATSKQDKNAYVLSHEEASLIDLLRTGATAQPNAA